jgi:hypothetical protein
MITLGTVFAAAEAWRALSLLPLAPRIAYKILKYGQALAKEVEIVEKQRMTVVSELTNGDDTTRGQLKPGTPLFAKYVQRMDEVAAVPCSVEPLDISMDDLLSALDAASPNAKITPGQLAMLEPFLVSAQT